MKKSLFIFSIFAVLLFVSSGSAASINFSEQPTISPASDEIYPDTIINASCTVKIPASYDVTNGVTFCTGAKNAKWHIEIWNRSNMLTTYDEVGTVVTVRGWIIHYDADVYIKMRLTAQAPEIGKTFKILDINEIYGGQTKDGYKLYTNNWHSESVTVISEKPKVIPQNPPVTQTPVSTEPIIEKKTDPLVSIAIFAVAGIAIVFIIIMVGVFVFMAPKRCRR